MSTPCKGKGGEKGERAKKQGKDQTGREWRELAFEDAVRRRAGMDLG